MGVFQLTRQGRSSLRLDVAAHCLAVMQGPGVEVLLLWAAKVGGLPSPGCADGLGEVKAVSTDPQSQKVLTLSACRQKQLPTEMSNANITQHQTDNIAA